MKPNTDRAIKTLTDRIAKLGAVTDYILENNERLESDAINMIYVSSMTDSIIIMPETSGEGRPVARLFPDATWEREDTRMNYLTYVARVTQHVTLKIHHAEVNPVFGSTEERSRVIL